MKEDTECLEGGGPAQVTAYAVASLERDSRAPAMTPSTSNVRAEPGRSHRQACASPQDQCGETERDACFSRWAEYALGFHSRKEPRQDWVAGRGGGGGRMPDTPCIQKVDKVKGSWTAGWMGPTGSGATVHSAAKHASSWRCWVDLVAWLCSGEASFTQAAVG